MKIRNPKVDAYLGKQKQWQKELRKLRSIIQDCQLTEELKWGVPCYSFEGGNVVLMHVFNEYCALLFFKGALLPDPHGILVQQTKNTQSARQIRLTSLREITSKESILKAYVESAIKFEMAGLKVQLKKTTDYDVPEELQAKLAKSPALETAFKALTPGRQRAYLLYFAAAKQPKTRESRVERSVSRILAGKGLDD